MTYQRASQRSCNPEPGPGALREKASYFRHIQGRGTLQESGLAPCVVFLTSLLLRRLDGRPPLDLEQKLDRLLH